MSGFSSEQYVEALVKIISRDNIMDLCGDTKFYALKSLTALMDIFP